MRTKKPTRILLGLSVVIAAFMIYNYIYQDHRDITSEAPAFTVTAMELSKAFQEDETSATGKYLNQTILVQGSASVLEEGTAMMGSGIFFALSENQNATQPSHSNEALQIKGRCIGYDSLLDEIKFDQAIIIN